MTLNRELAGSQAGSHRRQEQLLMDRLVRTATAQSRFAGLIVAELPDAKVRLVGVGFASAKSNGDRWKGAPIASPVAEHRAWDEA